MIFFGEFVKKRTKKSVNIFQNHQALLHYCLSQKLSVIIPLIDELILTKVKGPRELINQKN